MPISPAGRWEAAWDLEWRAQRCHSVPGGSEWLSVITDWRGRCIPACSHRAVRCSSRAIDSSARRIYLSHGTQVDVVDADSGKVVGTIPDTPGVHGAAIASEFKHGFTSNGREDKVSMFDPATLQLIKKIDVGKGPDGIYYDPATKRVFTNNHGSHDISAIDAKSGDVVGTVKVEGDGEQAVIGGDGLIYVNSEDTAEVVVFN